MSSEFFFLLFILCWKPRKTRERTCAHIHEQRKGSLGDPFARCRCFQSGLMSSRIVLEKKKRERERKLAIITTTTYSAIGYRAAYSHTIKPRDHQ
jgi:hypothetical protein